MCVVVADESVVREKRRGGKEGREEQKRATVRREGTLVVPGPLQGPVLFSLFSCVSLLSMSNVYYFFLVCL